MKRKFILFENYGNTRILREFFYIFFIIFMAITVILFIARGECAGWASEVHTFLLHSYNCFVQFFLGWWMQDHGFTLNWFWVILRFQFLHRISINRGFELSRTLELPSPLWCVLSMRAISPLSFEWLIMNHSFISEKMCSSFFKTIMKMFACFLSLSFPLNFHALTLAWIARK